MNIFSPKECELCADYGCGLSNISVIDKIKGYNHVFKLCIKCITFMRNITKPLDDEEESSNESVISTTTYHSFVETKMCKTLTQIVIKAIKRKNNCIR